MDESSTSDDHLEIIYRFTLFRHFSFQIYSQWGPVGSDDESCTLTLPLPKITITDASIDQQLGNRI